MVVSGSGEREVEVSGERAAAGSSEGERAAVDGSGSGEGCTLLDSLHYPCTTRLRLRRLLAFLRGSSHWGAYEAINGATCGIFHVRRLMNHVKGGQWFEALTYVLDFGCLHTSGYEATNLVLFLQKFRGINDFADGGTLGADRLRSWFLGLYKHPALATKYPCFATIVADFLSRRSDHTRAFLDWQLVRNKAATIVQEMASKTPELKDKMHFPRGRNSVHDVVNIGCSFRRRRPVKNCGRKQSSDLAQFYIKTRNRLPSLTQGEIPDYSGSETMPAEPLIELIERALQAGRRLVIEQGHPTESSSKKGVPLMRTMEAKPTMVASSSFLICPRSNHRPGHLLLKQVHQPGHSSKQDRSGSLAVMASPGTSSAMKRLSLQECHIDTARPGTDSKRARTIGNFSDDPSLSFKAPVFASCKRRNHVKSGVAPEFPGKFWSVGKAMVYLPGGGGI